MKSMYNEIYSYFIQADKKNLADFVTKICKERKLIANENKQLKGTIKQLENEQENNSHRIEALENELNSLRCRGIGIDPAKGSQIKYLYEQGWLLRKIGEYCDCDKSTVQRMLIKMGVQIRKKGGDSDAPGENK